MLTPPVPPNETGRLAALRALKILDTAPEQRFDRITAFAKDLFQVPIALVSLVDQERQWFKSRAGLDATETPRSVSFCGHAILADEPFVIEDATADERFSDNPLVTGAPFVRFYAGVPLIAGGFRIGTLCLIGHEPRRFENRDRGLLKGLAGWVERELTILSDLQVMAIRLESQARLEAVLEGIAEGVTTADPAGEIQTANPAAASMFGCKVEELIGRDMRELVPERQRVAHDGYMRRLNELPDPLVRSGLETTGLRSDGSEFSVQVSFSRLKVDGQRIYSAIFRDISERKRHELEAEQRRQSALELARLQQKYAAIIASSDDAIMSKTLEGIITSWNPAAERLFGYSAQEAIGRPGAMLIPPERADEEPNLLERIGRGERFEHFETVRVRKDGKRLDVSASISPILDDGGQIVGASKIVRDISERKRDELQLRSARSRLRAIIDTVVDGIITIDERGSIETLNPATERLFGYAASEMVGRNVRMLMPEPYQSEHDRYLRNYRLTGLAKIIGSGREVTGRRKDGTTFPMELAVSEMEHEGRRMYTGVVRDISERKRIETMKSEFISTVSHELRTPLTSIRGALGLVVDGFAGEVPEQAREMINIAHNNSERLVRLINDILDMEKIEAGKMAFVMQPIPLKALLESAVTDNAGYAATHDIRFEVMGDIPEVLVNADRDRMLQVLTNLLSNAAKFSPGGQTVSVSAIPREGNFVQVSVEDRGPGIPVEFHDRIFGRFAQADSSDTRQKGGTGLGLSITKAIVERHGGAIGFNTVEGKGSVFYFDLPVWSEPVADPVPADDESGRARILICEDDKDIARLLSIMLTRGGYLTDVAYTAGQAKQKLSQKRYVAMTLDLALPDQDGISLIRELRSQPATRDLPIIVISAKAEQGKLELNGDAVGIIDWLEKPIDEDRLASRLRATVRSSAGTRPRILHIEDDMDILAVVAALVGNSATLLSARTLREAVRLLTEESFDLVILDLSLPDGSGENVLPLLQTGPGKGTPVIVFSARDVSGEAVASVERALVKSRTTNEELLRTIKSYVARVAAKDGIAVD